MALAHAACYAMALNATLGRKSASADRTVVTATVTADRGDAGIKIASSKLTVTAYGLKGHEVSQFAEVAKEAEGDTSWRTRSAARCKSRSRRRSASLFSRAVRALTHVG